MQVRRNIVIVRSGFEEAPEVSHLGAGSISFRTLRSHQFEWVGPLLAQPLGVIVAGRVRTLMGVAVLKIGVAVIDAIFASTARPCQVQLAYQSTVVIGPSQSMTEQSIFKVAREEFVAIAVDPYGARIHAGKKAGPAGRTDRRLAEGVGEGDGLLHKMVQSGGMDMGISETADCVEALLITAIPENIWTSAHSLPVTGT